MNQIKQKSSYFQITVAFAALLALFVVMLGAYTRLTNAGLGCPDWPGCYGHLVLPSKHDALAKAQLVFPETPIESSKAWTEMAHRYVAGTLGLMIIMIAVGSFFRNRRQITGFIPLVLLALLFTQAALGMWTVTLKLLPIVVMGHLLGGILIFSTLCLLFTKINLNQSKEPLRLKPWLWLGMMLMLIQIALGGWVSANYAGISCIGFPFCNGQWLPHLDMHSGFYLFQPVGDNYQGGLLEAQARANIQMVHRLGALIVFCYISSLATVIMCQSKTRLIKNMAKVLLGCLVLQIIFGIINVLYLLPLPVAVLHNGVAALLMATMLSLTWLIQTKRGHA